MPVDDEFWERLKGQLTTAHSVTLTGSFLPKPDNHGFTQSEVMKVASFMVDVCDGDPVKAIAYARRFEKAADDRVFSRAVRVAVERKLNV